MRVRGRVARLALACAASLGAVACGRRASRDAGAVAVDRPRDVVAPPPDVPRVTTGSRGPWKDLRIISAAASNATQGAAPGEILGAVALPEEDLTHAELRLVRWGEQGAEVIARHTITGMIPGGAMSLLRRNGGYTVVWFPLPADGGVEARAIDAVAQGFTNYERGATPEEAETSAWARDALGRRVREKVDEPAVPVTVGGHAVRIEARRPPVGAIVYLDDLEITRGVDLLGYQRAVGLGIAPNGRRWVAVLRGHCREARVEVYRVDGSEVVLRGSFPVRVEIGVRWMHVDARDDGAVVTWYQDLIPIRLDCTRGDGGTTTADHGVRVAYVDDRAGAP